MDQNALKTALDPILKQLEKQDEKLEKQDEKLETINDTLKTVAVQGSRLNEQDRKIDDLYAKWNSLTSPEHGVIPQVQKHQATCPRKQVYAMWLILIPLCGLILSLTGLILHKL